MGRGPLKYTQLSGWCMTGHCEGCRIKSCPCTKSKKHPAGHGTQVKPMKKQKVAQPEDD